MNSQSIRAGLAFGNVLLTLGVMGLGWYTFFTRHEPPAGTVVTLEDAKKTGRVPGYNPVKLALPHQARASDPLGEYAIVWQSLDKPPPPPPPPVQAAPERPTPRDLESIFQVVLVALHPEDPKLNQCIINPRGGGESVVLQVGDTWNGYKCTAVDERKDGEQKVCVVTLVDGSGSASVIRLRRGE